MIMRTGIFSKICNLKPLKLKGDYRWYSSGYLRDAYLCEDQWKPLRHQSPVLSKIKPQELYTIMDQKYNADKVISAVDVDLLVHSMGDPDSVDELEEMIHRLRKSPATSDTLPSTSHGYIRTLWENDQKEDVMRILNDRMNYGMFIDHYFANIMMDGFIKEENHRDAAKIASLLMLEEDFGPSSTKWLSIISCLKYILEPKPDPWEADPEEPSEETKVRLKLLRNVYFDSHFDLNQSALIVGKTLAKAAESIISEDKPIAQSLQLLGWGMYGKWDKVEQLLSECASSVPIHSEAVEKLSEYVDKAQAEIDSSPSKTLAKPRIRGLPGMNVDEKEVEEFWKKMNYPDYSSILPKIKPLSQKLKKLSSDKTMLEVAELKLSSVLSENENKEISQQIETYKEWDRVRQEELEKQLMRFKAYNLSEEIEEKKKKLKEEEEVVFFFDKEEEWMMKLPPDEQPGYRLPEKYMPRRYFPFVKTVAVKKEKKRKT